MPQQVALITGTSSGFGRLLVEGLAARDTIVYATMRRIERHQEVVTSSAHWGRTCESTSLT
jgi:NAD(P)-dependent dehydrogenase (short-subunit alcohol dehydrogenase family)